jgi:hypothetical protein
MSRGGVTVVIDNLPYRVTGGEMTAAQLRALPHPPIGRDRDIWLAQPNGGDRFLTDTETVELTDGMRLFTAPRAITAGAILVDVGALR